MSKLCGSMGFRGGGVLQNFSRESLGGRGLDGLVGKDETRAKNHIKDSLITDYTRGASII